MQKVNNLFCFYAFIVCFKAFLPTQMWPVLFAVAQMEPPPSLFAGCEGDRLHGPLVGCLPSVRKSDFQWDADVLNWVHRRALRGILPNVQSEPLAEIWWSSALQGALGALKIRQEIL